MANAETRVTALKGMVNANTIIAVCNNDVPLKILTNNQANPARRMAMPIENIPVIFNANWIILWI